MSEQPEVSLRPFETADAAAVHRWFNNPEAIKTLMEQRDEFTPDQAEAWTRRAMDESGEDRKYAIVVEGYDERQRRRLEVLPGLTGWAQIHGRAALSWEERIELDVWYVDHRSASLDLRILARTARLLLTGHGLYG